MNLDRLFRPRRIAVYGGKWSDYVVEQCVKLGYDGEIWRVHPRRGDCFPGTDALPGAPDSVFLGINRELTVVEFEALSRRGVGGAVVFASGFGEFSEGAEFAARLDEASAGVPFIGPNCYGFANFFDRVALWPDQVVGEGIERGVAIIGQSGTISLTLMYQRRSLPIGYVITVGNQQRLSCADLVRYVADDPRVSAIGLYVEGLGDPASFAAAVSYARERGTPVALVKAGRSEKSRLAALSHTGAMTGDDALHDALFARLGVARCETLDDLVETLKLLHCHGPMTSNRLMVAGASGGDIAMVSDAARDLDIDFAPLPASQLDELDAATGPGVRLDNPLDFQTYTWFDADSMRRMFAALLDSDYALTAFMIDPPDETLADPSAYDVGIDAMLDAARQTGFPGAVVSSLPESLSRYNRERCLAAGVAPMQGLRPFLRAFENAAATARAWRDWRPPALVKPALAGTRMSTRSLSEAQGKSLLAAHGIAVPQGRACVLADVFEAAKEIGGATVVKAVREGLVHKSDVNGVALRLAAPAEAAAAAESMRTIAGEFLVEAMIDDGVAELIAGVGLDPQFGHFVTIGAGGVLAELMADSITLLPPFNETDVVRALAGLRIHKMLTGWRGRPSGDIDALVDTVLKVAALAESLGDALVELDINPLIVRPAGFGAVAADTLVTLKET